MHTAYTPQELGQLIRSTRRAVGTTQAEMAAALQVRRQTIAELERGGNVGMHVMFNALVYLGKGIAIADARPTAEALRAMLDDDE
ncbi:helix-turn-helix domain-containing protein [Cupriavidus cauae]|jgi:Predicted transcriptional regulators|uniref:helix-turn-helix domain-containing protein n=2 Tax=Cupriavidus TaxID=106589 RepID=UPI002244D870|nr:helix-turn-helix domain-containing protein [Cupriavidus cauae]UZN50978.1 helix-turn-helix domain-containing protein [Cupriavidus cauae]